MRTMTLIAGLGLLALTACKGDYAGLTGEWSSDWGKVVIVDGKGTYTDTYGTGPGTIEFTKVGDRSFAGKWGESDKRHGTMTVTLSEDGKLLVGTWAPDANVTIGAKQGGSIGWTKK